MSPVATPVPVDLVVLDSNLNLVARIRSYGAAGYASWIALSVETFVPEKDRNLTVADSQGGSSSWDGTGLDGATQLPAGYYLVRLEQPGAPPIDKALWIRHEDYGGGQLAVLGSGRLRAPLELAFAFGESVALDARVYNLAGELVSQGSALGTKGKLALALRATGGGEAASGIYLIVVRGRTQSGGLEFTRLVKAAVLR